MKNIYLPVLTSLLGGVLLVSSCEKEEESQEPLAEPSIILSSNSISFGSVSAGTSSDVQTYTVTGEDLRGDVTLSTQAPFAVATSADGTFEQTLNFTTEDFASGPLTVFTRFDPADSDEGDFTGEITHSTEGIANAGTIALSGTSVVESSEPETGSLLAEEQFDYTTDLLPSTDNTGTGADNAAIDGWVKVRSANDGIFMHTDGLSFAGYSGSDVGKAVFLQKGAASESDLYVNNLTEPQDDSFTGDFYVAYMIQVEGYPAKSQYNRPVMFVDWKDNGTAAFMTATTVRNRAAADAAEDDVVFGLKFEGEEFQNTEIVPEIGKTYLIVMKHTVTDADLTNNNDVASLYVIDGEIPASEPATPDLLYENTPDRYMVKGISLLEDNSNPGAYIIDGIKVANNWEDLFK
jgi:hypothetical protein